MNFESEYAKFYLLVCMCNFASFSYEKCISKPCVFMHATFLTNAFLLKKKMAVLDNVLCPIC